jgi:hypothetical protein
MPPGFGVRRPSAALESHAGSGKAAEGRRTPRRWRAGRGWRVGAIASLAVVFPAFPGHAGETHLKADERIVFHPTVAQRVPGATNLWRAPIRGCVYEPEARGLWVAAFREALELKTEEMTAAEAAVFGERARLFLVDHERGKDVFIRLGTNECFVGKSGADGRFAGEVLLGDADWERRPPVRRRDNPSTHAVPEAGVPFVAVLRLDDPRSFRGAIFPVEAEGVSVISDIDDTIKITEVCNKRATLRNTFLLPFQPVPGMAEFYQALAGNPLTRPTATLPMNPEETFNAQHSTSNVEGRACGHSLEVGSSMLNVECSPWVMERDGVRGRSEELRASSTTVAFHYISASPWQLYEPLAAFVISNGFPAGTFELKEFRWKDRSFFSLFGDPEKYKLGVIEPLLKQFPKRKFILIGDSGERDPEIYGALARKFPKQTVRIYIRDVTNEPADAARYREAFRGVPQVQWRIFREPAEIKVAPE